MTKKTFLLSTSFVLGVVMFPALVFADVNPTLWKYVKPIVLSGSQTDVQYLKADIDREVSMHTRADLADIRIIANGTDEVPYQLVIENDVTRNESTNASISDLSVRDGETSFLVDIGEFGRLHDHLSVMTDSRNFKRKVSVFVSETPFPVDHVGWRLVTDEGYIYNFSDERSGFNAGSGEVSYPKQSSRYVKIVIHKGEGTEVNVTGAKIFRLVEQKQREEIRTYPISVHENLERKTTEMTIDIGGEGLPSRRIELQTDEEKNFNRRVVLHTSADGVSWSAIGEGYVFSLRTPLFTGRHLTIDFRETRARYLRVVVMNEDDAPVRFKPEVTVAGVVRSVVFSADPRWSYMLYYGNEKSVAPRYDFARFFQYIESTSLERVTLGAETSNPLFAIPPPRTVPFTERNAVLLNGALVLLVGFVMLLTFSYLKKLKLSKRGPKEGENGV